MKTTELYKERRKQFEEALNFIEGYCMVRIAEDDYRHAADLYFDIERAAEAYSNMQLGLKSKEEETK